MPQHATTPSLGMQDFFSTTLNGAVNPGDTVINLNAVPTATEGFLVIDPNNTSTREIIYYNSKTSGSVTCPDATQGSSRGLGGTTAQSHVSATLVEMRDVAEYWSALQNGQSLNAGTIRDTNGNAVITLGATTSAVDGLTVTNAATANPATVTVSATGTDSNINLNLVPKGTGQVQVGGLPVWWQELGRTTLGGTGSITVSFTAKAYLMIIGRGYDSTSTSHRLVFNNDTGNNYASVWSSNMGAGIVENSAVSAIVADTSNNTGWEFTANITNVLGKVKYGNSSTSASTADAASTAVKSYSTSFKWSNTANQITSVQFSGSYLTGSELIVLGHD